MVYDARSSARLPSATRRFANGACINLRQPASARRWHRLNEGRSRKPLGPVDIGYVATLNLDQRPEFLKRAPISQGGLSEASTFIQVTGAIAYAQHVGTDVQAMFPEIRGAVSMKGLQCLYYFDGVSDGVSKRLIHV
jgi:hypothetical protein